MNHFCKFCNVEHLREQVGTYKNRTRTRPKFIDETGRAWISENMCSKSLRPSFNEVKKCLECQTEFSTNKTKRKFCCNVCQKKYHRKNTIKSDR